VNEYHSFYYKLFHPSSLHGNQKARERDMHCEGWGSGLRFLLFSDKGDHWRRKIPTWGQGSDNDYYEKHCMELRLLQINCVLAQLV